MTNQDKNHQKDQKGGAGKPADGREHERQEEQRQQEKGRDTKPGGRNDDQSRQPGQR